MRFSKSVAADKIRDTSSSSDARCFGNCVTHTKASFDERESVVEEILKSKAEQIPDFKVKLNDKNKNTVFTETTCDMA